MGGPTKAVPAELRIKNVVKAIETGFFSEAELALRQNINPRTLQRWNAKGCGPKPTLIHKKRFYEKSAVYQWEREREQRPVRRLTAAKGARR